MDCGFVLDPDGDALGARRPSPEEGRHGRRRRQGRRHAGHLRADADGPARAPSADAFTFMSSEVSREKPIDYAHMARVLIEEKERGGYPVWVTGPGARALARAQRHGWFIANGYVGALLAGNAVAVHDIEASIYGTTLGMTNTGEITQGGHGLHMRAINMVRAAGSIAKAVEKGIIKDGIMYSCVKHNVPFVLTGSIRDDGPLPDVITDALAGAGRDARARDQGDDGDPHRDRAARDRDGQHAAGIRHASRTARCASSPTICVDSSEFVVSKLKDRGTHQAFGVVTNAQDFMHILRLYVERELDTRRADAVDGASAADDAMIIRRKRASVFSSRSPRRSRPSASPRFISSRRSSRAEWRAASPSSSRTLARTRRGWSSIRRAIG